MKVLVYDGQIAGRSDFDNSDQLPVGFILFEAPNVPLDQLWFTGLAVEVKPEKPERSAVWAVDRWVVPVVQPLPIVDPLFTETELFDTARIKARSDMAVLTELTVALFAANNHLPELLASAKANLEEILTT